MVTAQTGTIAVTRQGGDGAWVIALAGEHDISTNALREAGTDGVLRGTCAHVVIDLSGADFVDSSVIAWLLRSQQAIAAVDAGVTSVVDGPPSSPAARMIDLVGMRHELACHATRQAAFEDPRADATSGLEGGWSRGALEQDRSAARSEYASSRRDHAWAERVAARYDADGQSAYAAARLITADPGVAAGTVLEVFLARGATEAPRARLLLQVCRLAVRHAPAAVERPLAPSELVNALPADERETLVLCLHGVRCSEIAELEGSSHGVVIERVQRALSRVRAFRSASAVGYS